ncbi:MAG: hydrolase [Arenimonas sp. SCN 70-307]|uniref:metal-dependent hydrolase family protein n=1 Tax=Arenimonas sp. SCN 70-307 TaxID=1660089 RepID=UPI00086D819D|nr:amidohydrolase family protein [Arenimonas sp. SCN 70-307]ODS63790.1 MAG: hydrolase [Arenimonas sp. SCN 70-307]
MKSTGKLASSLVLGAVLAGAPAAAQDAIVFQGVRVFDGVGPALSEPTNVRVSGNRIEAIGPTVSTEGARVIDGRGRTLMPGLIDVHVHMTFSAMDMATLQSPELTPESAGRAAAVGAEQMLLRGVTSVRDMGGPVFPLKAAIDAGKVKGPRIWPSGAHLSQTSGHGDLRAPHEGPRRFTGKLSRAEQLGATWIVDGRDDVLTATRENLRFGASQIKIMAGGGTSSDYDPLDVTQYTLDEMRAAVEAADDWNTYVTVHAYHARSVRRAIEAGVKCIEHGQLLDDETLALMAEKGVWLSLQMLQEDSETMAPSRRAKRKPVIDAQQHVWARAKAAGVKLAWGTDILFDPAVNKEQTAYLLRLRPWFTPAEILKLATHDNAQLLALSGPRSPYQGELGVVREGALADLILVDGDPLANLELVADPTRNFVVIMKDGALIKEPK